ncbi:hypothetical protein BHE74_00045989 [Ensete ventricosum]|nr:hypothetical protein GW17_00049708 [Ensete ventricosum]RWW47979.1 hypothetical protein BHE74_00045989 [Ensete ventricosum]
MARPSAGAVSCNQGLQQGRPARKGRRFPVTRLQGQHPPTICHPAPTVGVAATPFYSPPSLCARVARLEEFRYKDPSCGYR